MASKLIRKVISTSNAPKAAGPYRYSVNVFYGCFKIKMILRVTVISIFCSQAIVADRTIYVAGQLGLDPKVF